MSYVEAYLGGRAFLIGDTLTGADVMMGFPLEVMRAFGS